MTAVTHLSSFYSSAKIILWVEDAVTRDYLKKLWGETSEIDFYIAGNNSAVRPVVDTARREGIGHVFGLVDRDFGHTNFSRWATADVFYLPRHEIENYSLDADAIAGCSLNNFKRKRTLEEIQQELQRLAGLQPAWLAYRRVLNEMEQDLSSGFPSTPAVPVVPTLAAAEQRIVTSGWFTQLASRATQWTTGQVNSALQAAESVFSAALVDKTWGESFSGKEIFRVIKGYVYNPPKSAPKSAGAHDSDFAKAIGEWQLANGRVPADLLQLRASLRSRVGLPP